MPVLEPAAVGEQLFTITYRAQHLKSAGVGRKQSCNPVSVRGCLGCRGQHACSTLCLPPPCIVF